MIPLKGGYVTLDPRLDRVPEKDPRSRDFPVRPLLRKVRRPRSYTWSACDTVLDQGAEGACVGFGWAHELAARPSPVAGMTNEVARRIYHRAQELDEYEGQEPQVSGSSVLAGAKAVCELGYLKEFRWAFGIDDVILTIGFFGPVVLGIDWHSSMYNPDGDTVVLNGDVVGGHCIIARGVSVKTNRILLHNSWGPDWGVNGDAWIDCADLDRLLRAGGEACIPVQRRRTA